MKLSTFYIDCVLRKEYNNLSEMFTEDYQQKELNMYTKILEILPNQYIDIESQQSRQDILKYAITKVDKRCKVEKDFYISDIDTFYIMLLIYKNNSIYKNSSAIEIKELYKEFSFLSENEINKLLDSLHNKNFNAHKYISLECRADLNQIRFNFEAV